jgi:hypothetical protein
MELRVRGLTRDEMNRIDEDAAERGMRRNDYVKAQLLGEPRPISEGELDMLLAAKARAGNMRAIELLWRRVPAAPPVTTAEPKESTTLAEVIALANRGRPRRRPGSATLP